jgi:predicted TIM-barrel fold metal-dependent hydrolase
MRYSRILCAATLACVLHGQEPDKLLLKDYQPHSIFKIPQSHPLKPKYPAIDVHYHVVRGPDLQPAAGSMEERLKVMDEVGIEKTVILTLATGARFDAVRAEYSRHPDRFELWCGLDYDHLDQPAVAVAELERCARSGAGGVGEIGDKGKGLGKSGVHPDDPRMDAIWEKCADLKLPVNIHVADPIWAYQKMDATNDGLMDGFKWRLDDKPDIVDHAGMIEILERTVKRHPRTVFIACHLANLDFDLAKLGGLLDRYPNLYADVSARLKYIGTIPRVAAAFLEKYQDRILYGTDAGFQPAMYRASFRALESADDHYYEGILPSLHWPLYGLALSDGALRKIYRENALRLLKK